MQSTNEAVFAVEFNPSDSTNIITCGKSHVYFWTLSAGQFTKKQGIFGVRFTWIYTDSRFQLFPNFQPVKAAQLSDCNCISKYCTTEGIFADLLLKKEVTGSFMEGSENWR